MHWFNVVSGVAAVTQKIPQQQQQLLPLNPKSSPQLPTQPPPCFLYVDAGSVDLEKGRVGGPGETTFSFFLCSQPVSFKFPMGSHQVPHMFARFPMCSPRMFPISPGFNLICFAQSPRFSTI